MIRACLFYLGASVSVLLTYLTMLILSPAGLGFRHRLLRMEAGFLLAWLRLTCGVRHQVVGLEHVPEGACVLLCKHQSAWETLALTRLVPHATFVLKKELIEAPILGFGFRAVRPIAIDRGKSRDALREVVRSGTERLADGLAVVIFPEGTRVSPGASIPYRKSGAELARRADVPLVPVAHNAGSFWRHGEFAKVPGEITLEFGPVMETGETTSAELTERARAWIEARVAALEASGNGAGAPPDPA